MNSRESPQPQSNEVLVETHADLSRRYQVHAVTIERTWRSFDEEQRIRAMVAGSNNAKVLKHRSDTSMGNICFIIPEWNLEDIAKSEPEFLLDLFKERATRSLIEQYHGGLNGRPGDYTVITSSMSTHGIKHANHFVNCFTLFHEGESYGSSYEIDADHVDEVVAGFRFAIEAGTCVPQGTGELILQRQIYLCQLLSSIVEDILEEASQGRKEVTHTDKGKKIVPNTRAGLSASSAKARLSFAYILKSAQDQRSAAQEYLELLSSESDILAHEVNIWFYTRSELLPDDRGRRLQAHTDKYISGAFCEAITASYKSSALWVYLNGLLDLLQDKHVTKIDRAQILQEVSNICHLQYNRAKNVFQRQIRVETGARWFKRVAGAYGSDGNARVTMKGQPESLTREDPQLHYILRLCQPQTTPVDAIGWIEKLHDLYERFPSERDRLEEREFESLSKLAVVVEFVNDLSITMRLPPMSNKKGQKFLTGARVLEDKLTEIKTKIDLRNFAAPIDSLLNPEMAAKALQALNQAVIAETGGKMEELYQNLIQECCAALQPSAKPVHPEESPAVDTTWPQEPSLQKSERIDVTPDEPKTKLKTRADSKSIRNEPSPIDLSASTALAPAQSAPAYPLPVSRSTLAVFTSLFWPTSPKSRGSITWASFEQAMVELKFSVLPKYGSVYKFEPTDHQIARKAVTVHRPHKSRIEGHQVPILARKLNGIFGWDQGTFVGKD